MPRQEKIISIVNERKKVEVNELAELLDVSKVTIRKDLDKLESKGFLHRQHGYAVLNNQDDINYRLAKNYDQKRRIAVKAAETVSDGETVMIESGSTCTILAEILAFQRQDITIITNSCFLANYVRKAETVKIVLLGGEYQKESQVNVGPLVRKVVDNFRVDKLFVGIDGFDPKRGFTGSDISRCDTARSIATAAKQTVILTDSSKFENEGILTEFSFDEVDQVFTDEDIRQQARLLMEEKNIQVITS